MTLGLPETLIVAELFGYEPGAFSAPHAKGKADFSRRPTAAACFLD